MLVPDAQATAAPAVHALVQHDAPPAVPEQAPLLHGAADASKRQPFSSWLQVASWDADAQTAPTVEQIESATHVHRAVPAGPVQVWRVGHATGLLHWLVAPQVSRFASEH
jgi:hypothetical protein